MDENMILARLEGVASRFEEVGRLITEPEIISDMKRYVKLNKEYSQLEPLVQAYNDYENILSNIRDAKEILAEETDAEMKEMAKAELEELNTKLSPLEDKVKMLLVPNDPEDDKDSIVEIRAGTGGDEASIFAGDLYRMYLKFAESK
nr:PCRF domain-containing protein [Bacteroidales bacterium]